VLVQSESHQSITKWFFQAFFLGWRVVRGSDICCTCQSREDGPQTLKPYTDRTPNRSPANRKRRGNPAPSSRSPARYSWLYALLCPKISFDLAFDKRPSSGGARIKRRTRR
jgi:hypothetical protein